MKKMTIIKAILIVLLLAVTLLVGCSIKNPTPGIDTDPVSYKVTFDSDGGTAVESQTVEEGKLVIAPKDPTKEGYDFAGWFVGKEEWSFKNDKVTANITLTAHWTEKGVTPHTCQHVCPTCGKCTDLNCTDPVCADKCPGHEIEEKENEVKVSMITAEVTKEESGIRRLAFNPMLRDVKDGEEELKDGVQYILLPVDKNEVTFTVKLSNPKAYQIDSLRLYCEDGLAEIKIDGEWKSLNVEQDGSRVVNWSSEDAYEKTFYLRMHSEESHNTLRVLDVRLAGHTTWQSDETKKGAGDDLGNNELNIFKLNAYDLRWVFVDNVEEYYAWKMNNGDKVTNLVVKADGEVITPNDGEYRVTKDCKVTWEYDYTCDGITVSGDGERDIEVLKIIYATEWIGNYGLFYDDRLHVVFSGTDTTIENIYNIKESLNLNIPVYGNRHVSIVVNLKLVYFGNDTYVFETTDGSYLSRTEFDYFLKIGNKFYKINYQTKSLEREN